MLRRRIYDYFVSWKKEKTRECLLVNGARQVGKTYIIDRFGRENYKSYICLNMLKNPGFAGIFEGSLEADEIYKKISLFMPGFHIKEHNTLIFIDEIQACPKARTALKFLATDSRCDVIASGSLLGIHYNKSRNGEENESGISVPVGYEREITLRSLDFEEFLWAYGITGETISILKSYYDNREKVPSGEVGINEKYLALLREYMVVGGMPEVVKTFLKGHSFMEAFKAQQKIFRAYEDDITHYAKNSEKPKIKAVYESLPRQLSKEYLKFQYRTVDKKGSARKYENALDWLIDAGLVCMVRNVSLPIMPLKAYEQPENFKIYASDIGLATAMFGFETQKALIQKTLYGPAKGGIYENLVFDILSKRGFVLNYYKKKDNSQEIEFIFEKNGSVIPVEVKSRNGDTESLNDFIKTHNPPYAIKLIDGNLGFNPPKLVIPQYMAMFI
jgi:hypothetical protein